jgi:hypothetical protein
MVHPWDFGWDALVAIGTISLALVTGYLALSTRQLARETAEEVASGSRPVLIPGRDLKFILETSTLEVWVHNVGGGPALFIQARTDTGVSTITQSLAALANGEQTVLEFDDGQYPPVKQVFIDYRDLAGRVYSSAIRLRRLEDHPVAERSYEYADVQVYRDVAVVDGPNP